MKKMLVSILICGIMIFGITGCSEKKNEEHSFLGKILEVSSSYIIVEPNEEEEERKSSDKFHIELKKDNTTYEVGTYIKITYTGSIKESYPAQIQTTNIEIIKKEEMMSNYTKIIENVSIEMNIPKEWNYEQLAIETNYKFALKINKSESDEYFVLYYFSSPFGVCGTERSVQELNLNNGKIAKIGYYDNNQIWSDISFYEINQNIALINYGTKESEVLSFIKTINIKKID